MARRIIKASQDSLAGLEVGENFSRLSADRENLVYVDESGCYIVGKISILTEPENIRIGGGFTLPPAYKAQLPSTAVNPQPILISNSPVQGFTSFAQEVATRLGELL
jgi:hypothetical protein